MIEITGAYNTAICYTPQLEPSAAEQIRAVCDQPAFADSKIRIYTWIKKAMTALYPAAVADAKTLAEAGEKLFGKYCGLAQQYLFYYARENKLTLEDFT